MSVRKVTYSIKDSDGNIIAVGNPDFENVWSPRAAEDAIFDIESEVHRYFVQEPETEPVYIQVLHWPEGKLLRSPLGCDPKNDLHNIFGEWKIKTSSSIA